MLRFHLRYTPEQLEWFASQETPPKAYENRPKLLDYLNEVWSGFWFLNLSRPVGFSVGAIPITEMIAYWRDLKGDFDYEQKIHYTRSMDEVYLEVSQKKDS